MSIALHLDPSLFVDGDHWVDFRPDTKVRFVGEGRTKQSFKDQADINFIMARYLKSGSLDYVARHEGKYGEVSPLSFHEAMNIVARSQEMFDDLPSELRKRFGHDPAAFLAFVQDSKNIDEMRKLGLASPAPQPEPTAAEARIAELEADQAARLELARRAVVAPPGGASHS